jgi:hypothetical protein
LFDSQGEVINSTRMTIGFGKMVDFDDVHARLNSGTTESKGTPNLKSAWEFTNEQE